MHPSKTCLVIVLALAALAVAGWPLAQIGQAEQPGGFVGVMACERCHIDFARVWQGMKHSERMKIEETSLTGGGCEACHGPGAKHIEAPPRYRKGNTRNPARLPAAEAAQVCLQCHQDPRRVPKELWAQGAHATATREETTCVTCHEMHNPAAGELMLRLPLNDLCLKECHQEVTRKANSGAHHRIVSSSSYPSVGVERGIISCVKCHNPHGSQAVFLLKGRESPELCGTCHRSGGPRPASHTPDWQQAHSQVAAKDKRECLKCHREEEFCTRCHGTPMPHLQNWVSDLHREVASFEESSLCFKCHQSDWCNICHVRR